ncbi:MAG: hypothetical protein KTR24_08550 [Saprospiraceae bacterium]|nr:hypothetical protein [Saprospiraceae bacterium]
MSKVLLLLAMCFLCLPSWSQEDQSKVLRYSVHELKNLTKIDLVTQETRLPRMYLQKVGRNDLTVMRVPTNQVNMETRFVTKTYTFDEINKMTLHNRSRKRKFGLIGSAIGAAAGVALGIAISKEKEQDDNLLLLNQRTESGFAEPIIGGIVGWGVGFVIGEFISPVRLSTQDRDFKKRLRNFSGSK